MEDSGLVAPCQHSRLAPRYYDHHGTDGSGAPCHRTVWITCTMRHHAGTMTLTGADAVNLGRPKAPYTRFHP